MLELRIAQNLSVLHKSILKLDVPYQKEIEPPKFAPYDNISKAKCEIPSSLIS